VTRVGRVQRKRGQERFGVACPASSFCSVLASGYEPCCLSSSTRGPEGKSTQLHVSCVFVNWQKKSRSSSRVRSTGSSGVHRCVARRRNFFARSPVGWRRSFRRLSDCFAITGS
jgi:hypothetical protein